VISQLKAISYPRPTGPGLQAPLTGLLRSERAPLRRTARFPPRPTHGKIPHE